MAWRRGLVAQPREQACEAVTDAACELSGQLFLGCGGLRPAGSLCSSVRTSLAVGVEPTWIVGREPVSLVVARPPRPRFTFRGNAPPAATTAILLAARENLFFAKQGTRRKRPRCDAPVGYLHGRFAAPTHGRTPTPGPPLPSPECVQARVGAVSSGGGTQPRSPSSRCSARGWRP